MKKKILSFILAMLMLLGVTPMALLSVLADGIAAIADDDPLTVSIVPITVHDKLSKQGKPDASGYARFEIRADGKLTENVTVYYKTADLSAVASAGDYEAKSGSVTLTPDEPTAEIAVKTARTVYSITTYAYAGRKYIHAYYARSFEVVIVDVQGNGAKANERASRAECALNAEYNLEGHYNLVLTPYTLNGDYRLNDFLMTQPWSENDSNFEKSVLTRFPSTWKMYLDSGIDAKLFVAIENAHIDESSWNSSSGVKIKFGNVEIYVQGEFHNDEVFGWGPAFMYADQDVSDAPSNEDGYEDKYKDYYLENFKRVRWYLNGRYYEIHGGADNSDGMDQLAKALRDKVVIIREYSSSGIGTPSTVGPEDYWLQIDESILDWNELSLVLDIDGGYSRRLTRGNVQFRLEDITAPTVKKNGKEYEIYHNFDTVQVGEKLRLAVRFTEPVKIDGKTPYLIGKANGRGTGAATDPYAVRFDYVGGSGTDTLYFEAEYNGNYLINSITDLAFSYSKSIVDLAGIPNELVSEKITLSGFTLDRRDPIINVDHDIYHATFEPIRSASIAVTVGQISNGAVLYYSWIDSKQLPENHVYQNSRVLDSISIYETQTVYINGGGEGEQYLHLKVATSYGKFSTVVRNSKTGDSKSCLGPYNLDNSAPGFGMDVLPLEGSDLTKKVYQIPIPIDTPQGTNAGFSYMKMYFVMPDGTSVCLKNPNALPEDDPYLFTKKHFNVTKDGRSYLNLTVTAADLNIGEKTRVEGVSVYFEIADSLGNIATDVSKHTVIFDTNKYVDVVSATTTNGFTSEALRGENTVLYPEITPIDISGKRVYYSFTFKIKEDASSCTNFISIKKRGEDEVIRVLDEQDGYRVRTVVGSSKSVIIDFTSPIEAGCYEIQLLCYDADTLHTALPDRVSEVYTVYIGEGAGALAETVKTGTVLINKVYQLPATSALYYMGKADKIDAVSTSNYNPDRLPMSFSSYEAARRYVLFNEYRDLYAVTLDEALAEALNSKTSSAQPALGETIEARAGQVWIRYKSISWTVGSKQSENWKFYYYGDSEMINPEQFSPLLNEALNGVVDLITKSGRTVALTDLSLKNGYGSSLLDEIGTPRLNPSQIVSSDLNLSDSTTPISQFSKDIYYPADNAIYSSTVVRVDSSVIREYILIGSLTVPSGSRFQYRRYNTIGVGYVSEEWTDIDPAAANGINRFRDVITENGYYEIRELSANGISTFDVHIDKQAPTVNVSWNGKDGESHSLRLSVDSEKEFRSASLTIMSIDNEVDKYAYVAIYKMVTSELYGVYTVTELQRTPVSLPDGKYYMVVADRSGNSYSLSLYINSTDMNCNIEKTENVRIRFTCDRDPSQIQAFYVKRDGVRIENVQYASSITFTESGTYEFYVEDIYGNASGVITETFTRDYPKLEWSYYDGGFVKYNEEESNGYFTCEKIADGSFKITTSVQMRFQMLGDYVYEFIGTPPSDVAQHPVNGYVTINSVQSFQLKVSYRDHPEVYSIYNCSADRTAPIIHASVQVYDLGPSELALLKDAVKEAQASGASIGTLGTVLENGTMVNGRFLTPSTIAYTAGKTQVKYLADGETALSDFIRVSASDENGLMTLEVYLNGERIKLQNEETGFSEIVLSRYGDYQIVAVDKLGNLSRFTFKNAMPDSFRYTVDGQSLELGLRNDQNFDSSLNYTAVNYGNSEVSFKLYEAMSVFYMITDPDGEKHFAAFDVDGGVIRALRYFLRDGGSVPELFECDLLLNPSDKEFTVGAEYSIFKEDGISVLARVDSDGSVTLTVRAIEGETITVEARLSTEDGEFYYNKTELSRIPVDLTFTSDGKTVGGGTASGQINVGKPFEIVTEDLEADGIVAVEVYFSEINDLDVGNLADRENIWGSLSYDEEGFYLVRARDRYGNTATYRLHLSDDFDVTSYVEFFDKTTIHYSSAYEGTLFSDSKIVFELHSNETSVAVQKDGEAYIPFTNTLDGITYVLLDKQGSYSLTLSDGYGNSYSFRAEIDPTVLGFNEALLSGYNENALKRDEGYTNRKLSVSEELLERELCYLEIRYGDSVTVLYDMLSESKLSTVSGALTECIGAAGDGEYTVIVRNRYGAAAQKLIHYRGTPTLTLERETRSSTELEPYSIEDAESIGFWSNGTLVFTTVAGEYNFTVNGDKAECPKTLSFAVAGQYGRNEYDIRYEDEYGFTYSFKAYLVRQDLEVNLSPDLAFQYINGVRTTKDALSVLFSENTFCTYTVNNSAPRAYTSGEKLFADGVYRFTVSDYAGNVAALTVKKDTAVEFGFKSNRSPSLQNGEAVNASKVEFFAINNDTAYIERVLKDGVVLKDFTGYTFTEDGRWEVIVADQLGNRAYFCFYIISRQQNGFSYTSPYEYHITGLWYDGGDGIKTSYMSFVEHTDSTSSFDFIENGTYVVTMASDITGEISTFEFTVNTVPPEVTLVGCNPGETTINDVTVAGLKVGDSIKIYKTTDMGEKLVKEVEITSLATQIPTVTEGGKYRIVVESEAGVATELHFVRKHVMNTSGSVFIMILVGVAAAGLFAGLVYRNKSKTDD